MFCSKCGKEIGDDAVFCSGCGASLNGEQARPSLAKSGQNLVSAEEKEKKIRAVATYCIQAFLDISVIIIIILTELKCFNFLFDGNYERALEYVWSKTNVVIYILGVGLIIANIVQGLNFYIIPSVRRNFFENKARLMISNIIDAVVNVICSALIANMIADELEISFPFIIVFVGIVLGAAKIFAGIAYGIAADAEKGAEYLKKKGSLHSRLLASSDGQNEREKWICKSCGTPNDKLNSQCKGCGKYK